MAPLVAPEVRTKLPLLRSICWHFLKLTQHLVNLFFTFISIFFLFNLLADFLCWAICLFFFFCRFLQLFSVLFLVFLWSVPEKCISIFYIFDNIQQKFSIKSTSGSNGKCQRGRFFFKK